MKTCYKCKETKTPDNFTKNKRYKDGLNDICKPCKKTNNAKVKEKTALYSKKYREKNKEYYHKYNQKYYQENKEYYQEYNKNRDPEVVKKYNKTQIDKGYKKQWSKNKYASDPNFRLSQILRIRLIDALKGKTEKAESALDILGCSIEELLVYLEKQFLPEMDWGNHGDVWELDHIIPCAQFDLTQIEEQRKCFHYSNLQPLFKTTKMAESFGYTDKIGNRNKHKN